MYSNKLKRQDMKRAQLRGEKSIISEYLLFIYHHTLRNAIDTIIIEMTSLVSTNHSAKDTAIFFEAQKPDLYNDLFYTLQ